MKSKVERSIGSPDRAAMVKTVSMAVIAESRSMTM
jgi:hypothetical protein